eukprot:Nk52_evm18s271 gene=Nk52_evmTU18s271
MSLPLLLLQCFATVATIGLFTTSMNTINTFHRTKSVGYMPAFPFFAQYLNCIFWSEYGVLIGDFVLILVNGTGLCFAMFYILVYYRYSGTKKVDVRKGVILCMVLTFLITLYVCVEPTRSVAVYRLGLVSSCFSVVMFGSPLASVVQVIRSGSTETMVFRLTLMCCIVSWTWVAYGFAMGDIFIKVPNTIGGCLSLLQMSLFVIYPNGAAETGAIVSKGEYVPVNSQESIV